MEVHSLHVAIYKPMSHKFIRPVQTWNKQKKQKNMPYHDTNCTVVMI